MAKKDFTENEGLLFYLSGEKGLNAEFAKGDKKPWGTDCVRVEKGGIDGKNFIQCDNEQVYAYHAPGNIYAERGTVSFFWRSHLDLGMTPFPIFRVSFADHSSWDMVFLRIDYNGQQQGFDAFVTDVNSTRLRVRSTMHPFLKKMEWVHLALAWDENIGIKFYINGLMVEQKLEPHILYAGLDKFAPHSRIAANWGVQSSYNFMHGGDLDELKIYDRMLSDQNIEELFENKPLTHVPDVKRSLKKDMFRKEWLKRNGWDTEEGQPKYYKGDIFARVVAIQDAFEHGLWSYKSMDGIKETAWPNTFNRSRLPGRNDYFQLPDWNCYYDSGSEITYTMPERWNQFEVSGSAFGKLYLKDKEKETLLDVRPRYLEHTVTTVSRPVDGKKIRFVNTMIEEPISEVNAFYVTEGSAPENAKRVETFYLSGNKPEKTFRTSAVKELEKFLEKRLLKDELITMYGVKEADVYKGRHYGLPFVNVILPYENPDHDGLDGIELVIPALKVKDTVNGYVNVKLEVKDPLWKYRNFTAFSFKVKAGEEKKVYLDLRDRILPDNKAMHLTISVSAIDFNISMLQGTGVSLYYKDQKAALAEHCEDRFNQVRDNYGNLLEESPGHPKHPMYERFMRDVIDILRYNPDHYLAQTYLWEATVRLFGPGSRSEGCPDKEEWHKKGTIRNVKVVEPAFLQPKPGKNVEAWAHYQCEYVKRLRYVVDWWIQNRMIENGEIGGGLSDDGDQMQAWVSLASLGITPDLYRRTHFLQMEAYYDEGMFVDGLAMIQADELHSYEDGIQMLTQALAFEPWNPRHLERAMETCRALYRVTDYNVLGERQFASVYYSGTAICKEDPWNRQDAPSLLVTGPVLFLALYSGNKKAYQLMMELADTLMHHYKNGVMHPNIDFKTGKDIDDPYHEKNYGGYTNWGAELLLAHKLTKNPDYLKPVFSHRGKVLKNYGQNRTEGFDKNALALENQQKDAVLYHREYVNTEGYTWSDRLVVNTFDDQIQRLGGVMTDRNYQYPQNAVTWSFASGEDAVKVGIYVAYASETRIKAILFNTTEKEIQAKLLGYQVDPGTWKVTAGTDKNGDFSITDVQVEKECYFENYLPVDFILPSKKTFIIEMNLSKPGVPYHKRPDLGFNEWDVKKNGNNVEVTVHSLGSVDAPETELVLLNEKGREVARTAVPALKAPNDCFPKTVTVTLNAAAKKGYRLVLDPEEKIFEITRKNNEFIFE